MEHLRIHLGDLQLLRNIVKNKKSKHYKYFAINQNNITKNTISIVMTSHERSKQTYFTLDTINKCAFKDIQVIVVDDSITDPVNIERLAQYDFNIELIRIDSSLKCWANPCINYNIGFEFVRGGKVIIQNSEVCYVGDILSYVNDNVLNNKYYVFDVKASRNYDTNEIIYRNQLTSAIYDESIWDIWDRWYQHHTHNNVNYHFLTACSRSTFDKINGFSYDYSFGSAYDDNDLLLKIENKKIQLINVPSDIFKLGGIHLSHTYQTCDKRAYESPSNVVLFEKKKKYMEEYGVYMEISEYTQPDTLVFKWNDLST